MPATVNVLPLATSVALINSVSAANTAAATSSGVDLTGYEGVVQFALNLGAVTGTIAGKIQGSVDNSAWNDLTAGGSFATSAANSVTVLALDTRKVLTSAGNCRYVRFVGTIVTGPSLVSVTMTGFKKVQ